MAFGILVSIYIAIFCIVIGLIIGVAIGVMKFIGYACIGIFIGVVWIGEKIVKLLLRPFISQKR